MIRLTIPGPPVGKARPRVTKNGTYTPKKTKEYEKRIQSIFTGAYPNAKPIEGPVSIDVLACFEQPKNKSVEWDHATKKPDADNILKIVCDALQGFAFVDDKQVVDASVIKEYSATACVHIALSALKG